MSLICEPAFAMAYQQKIIFGEMRTNGTRYVLIHCRDH